MSGKGSGITTDEVMAELARLQAVVREGPKGFVMDELAAALGMTASAAQRHLRILVLAGRVEFAGRRDVRRIDGVRYHVPVYRLVT